MTARANEIQFEAGSKMANALKNIVRAAIADTELSPESTRDVVDYFRRRALMSTEDAQGLLDEVAEYAAKRRPPEPPPTGKTAAGKPNASKVTPLASLAERLSLPAVPENHAGRPTAGPPSISSPAPAPVKVAPPSPIPEPEVIPLSKTSIAKAAAPTGDAEKDEDATGVPKAAPAVKAVAKAPATKVAAKTPAKTAAKKK